VLEGHAWLNGAGLWIVPVAHEGSRNSSAEEVEVVARIVEGLLKPEVKWFYGAGNSRRLKEEDILIVAPYNAQVSDLCAGCRRCGLGRWTSFRVRSTRGDLFADNVVAGRSAAWMEFLYSLNRLNVATSRAMTTVVLVGSPKLFEPECRTPRQMQLANAFCGYLEMAVTRNPASI